MNIIDRTVAPQVHTITGVTLPPQSVQTLSNGVRLHILDRDDMEVVRLAWYGMTANPCAARLSPCR